MFSPERAHAQFGLGSLLFLVVSMLLAVGTLNAGAQTGAMRAQPAAPASSTSGNVAPESATAGQATAAPATAPSGEGSASSRQELFPGYSASPATERFPGLSGSAPSTAGLAGYSASRVNTAGLSALPYVYALKRRDPSQMSRNDGALAVSLHAELVRQAAMLRFDLNQPGWSYQQIVCPALPDYLLLSFRHGPDPSGSSLFTAILERDHPHVEVVSTFAHGMKPYTAAWSQPSTFELFDRMLRRERGAVPLSEAPNWLVIGLCYANLSGYPVQALTSQPEPAATMDVKRLGGSLPQMTVDPDHSSEIRFSDVARSGFTTTWLLGFDKHGRIVSAELHAARQPAQVALKP